MCKILIYSHDTYGLGNIRRMTEIARHLVARDPNASVLILTGSPMLHAFRIPPRIDYVKLPCLARDRGGDYSVKFLSLHYQDTVRLRANLILSTLVDFRPDLVLVDKKPFGVGNELLPSLEMLARRAERPRLVLLLRDILDAPAATVPVWRKQGYYEAIERFYDRVLVVGSREVFDCAREYQFPAAAAAKVRYCGYIGREPGVRNRIAVRASLGVAPHERLVLVCAGGGADGYGLLESYLAGLRDHPFDAPVHSHIVSGPEMPEASRRELAALHARLPAAQRAVVSLRDFCDDMNGTIGAADVVVAMGGYNTVCELLSLRKRSVIVPRVRPVAEQWIRAERMARMGLLTALHPDDATPARLNRAVRGELERTNVVPHLTLDMDGLARVSAEIDGLLAARETVQEGEYRWALGAR